MQSIVEGLWSQFGLFFWSLVSLVGDGAWFSLSIFFLASLVPEPAPLLAPDGVAGTVLSAGCHSCNSAILSSRTAESLVHSCCRFGSRSEQSLRETPNMNSASDRKAIASVTTGANAGLDERHHALYRIRLAPAYKPGVRLAGGNRCHRAAT
jgi:hypothetical protein